MAIPHCGDSIVESILSGATIFEGSTNANEFVEKLIKDKVGSHLMEALIAHSTPNQFNQIFKKYFRESFLELCQHPLSNFVVQKVVEKIHKEKHFNQVVAILLPHFNDFICNFSFNYSWKM